MTSAALPSDPVAELAAIRLDRGSPVPLYFQLASAITEAITTGRLPAGTRLDGEVQLAERIGVSRPTMRKAMERLVSQGLLVRRRGIGTQVVEPKVRRSLELSSLFDDLRSAGGSPRTEVIANDEVAAEPEIAAALGLSVGAPVLHLVRLRASADQPIAKMENYLPAGLVRPTTDELRTRGLYDLLREAGITPYAATQVIGARNARPDEARLLDQRRGAALLAMERTAYDDAGRAIEFGRHLYAADRYSIHVDLLTR